MEPSWISVNDRLPKSDESTKYVFGSYSKEVVVLNDNGGRYFSKYCFDHYGDGVGWQRINSSCMNITHWIELPENPAPPLTNH